MDGLSTGMVVTIFALPIAGVLLWIYAAMDLRRPAGDDDAAGGVHG